MYTATKMIGLPKADNISSKFRKLMKTRQWCFILADLVFVYGVFCVVHDKNNSIIFELSGAYVIFQILLAVVDEVIYNEIKNGETKEAQQKQVYDETLIVYANDEEREANVII